MRARYPRACIALQSSAVRAKMSWSSHTPLIFS